MCGGRQMARFMLLATSILGLLGSALALPASKPDLQLDAAQDADTTNRINNCGAPCVDACMIECTDAQGIKATPSVQSQCSYSCTDECTLGCRKGYTYKFKKIMALRKFRTALATAKAIAEATASLAAAKPANGGAMVTELDADTTNRINNCGAPCVDACMIECTDAQGIKATPSVQSQCSYSCTDECVLGCRKGYTYKFKRMMALRKFRTALAIAKGIAEETAALATAKPANGGAMVTELDADTTNRINNCGAPCVDACMIECTDAQGIKATPSVQSQCSYSCTDECTLGCRKGYTYKFKKAMALRKFQAAMAEATASRA